MDAGACVSTLLFVTVMLLVGTDPEHGVGTPTNCASIPRLPPDVPTWVESGFPSLNAPTWFGAVAPAKTPAPVVAKLRTEFNAVIGSDAYAKALEARSMEVMLVPPEKSDEFLAKERALWSEAVKLTGASVN